MMNVRIVDANGLAHGALKQVTAAIALSTSLIEARSANRSS
jgi:hypothetical protein